MTGEKWRAVWKIFETASGMPRDQWEAHVLSQTDDREVAQRVLTLLEKPEEPLDSPAWQPADSSSRPLEGTRIGRYLIGGEVGRGGMGQVYAARDEELNRTVALKFLPVLYAGGGPAVDRFMREAKAASGLNHPNIVTVHEVIQEGASLAIVMEMVAGTSLRKLMGSPLPSGELTAIGQQIARALDAAHAAGIVHRDIKPENIMVRPDGYVKVLDFGLARDLSTNVSNASIFGTWRYMSPEQAQARPLGTPTDIFSLGVVLYEAATGRHPFGAESLLETLEAIVNREPAPPSSVNPLVAPEIESLILEMLRKGAAARPAAGEAAARLGRPAPLSPPVQPVTVSRGRSRRWVLGAAGAVSASAVGASLWRRALVKQDELLLVQGGTAADPVFSPDGARIAFSWQPPGASAHGIFVGETRARDWRPFTSGPSNDSHPVWSPDGTRIGFVRSGTGESALYVKRFDGKVERRIANIVNISYNPGGNRLDWLADNRTLVLASARGTSAPSLWLVDSETGAIRELTHPSHAGAADTSPKRSPDGRYVSFCRRFSQTAADLFLIPSEGGEPRRLTDDSHAKVESCWMPDGTGILFKARMKGRWGLWLVAREGGAVRPLSLPRVPLGTFDVRRGASPASLRVVSQDLYQTDAIWRSEIADGSPAKDPPVRFIASGVDSDALDCYPAISPNGLRIAFVSIRSGAPEIMVIDKNGYEARQLTNFGAIEVSQPSWAPDSRHIVFSAAPAGTSQMFVIDADTGAQRQLTSDAGNKTDPQWSRDGHTFTFNTDRGGPVSIWRMLLAGGAPGIVHDGAGVHRESPDGRWIYVYKLDGGLWRVPSKGGTPRLVLDRIAIELYRAWAIGRSGIYYVAREAGQERWSVRLYDPERGTERPVCTFNYPPTRWSGALAVSPDETWLLLPQREKAGSNIVLIPDLRV